MLCCQTRLWDSYVWMCTSVNMWVCLRDEVSCQESTTVSLPSCLKHAKPPHLLSAYCWLELHVYVCFCCLLGAATLPRLLMLYLLLIRMSRLTLAICTSWLDNPLPSVWCHWGSWRGVLPPNYKAKRPFCFVVVVFFPIFCKTWENSQCFHLAGSQGAKVGLDGMSHRYFTEVCTDWTAWDALVLADALTEGGRGEAA